MDKSGKTPKRKDSVNGIAVELRLADCSEGGCHEHHPNINAYLAVVTLEEDQSRIGHVKVHVFDKVTMDTIGVGRMWQECRNYDDLHMGAQMVKIEGYLENESFIAGKDTQIEEAQTIVFVEEVWLAKENRGRDLGLAAVRSVFMLLGAPPQSVALLQAGSVGESQYDLDLFQASEKLTQHWSKLGFEVWSDSDDSWLCLSLEDEVHGLKVLCDKAMSKD